MLLEKSDPWALNAIVSGGDFARTLGTSRRTNDEGNHGGSISAGGFKTLDQLLHLPDLDVLLGIVRLLLLGTHDGRGEGNLQPEEKVGRPFA